MLEDVQERLMYRTHIYIQTDITGYNPAPGDLAYPEKLEMMEVGGSINNVLRVSNDVDGIVHPKMKIMSSFIHTHVISYLYKLEDI